MANEKISEMPLVTSMTGFEIAPIIVPDGGDPNNSVAMNVMLFAYPNATPLSGSELLVLYQPDGTGVVNATAQEVADLAAPPSPIPVDHQTAVAGAATSNAPNIVVTSEALVAANQYTLVLTSDILTANSLVQITVYDDANPWYLNAANVGTGHFFFVINDPVATLTGSLIINISISN